MTKLDTGSFGEFGVQRKHLDGEGYLVDDALPTRLSPSKPKFQVGYFVIVAIAVAMMYVLVAAQRSSKHFFHNYAVLVFFDAISKMYAAVSRRLQVAFFRNWTPFATFIPTIGRAKACRTIVIRVLAIFGFVQATFCEFAAKFTFECRRRSSNKAHVGQFTARSVFVNAASNNQV